MRQLILASNSTQHGRAFLEHCAHAVTRLFNGRNQLLFLPYALFDWDNYARRVANVFAELGLSIASLHRSADPLAACQASDGIFIGGGNTFRLCRELHRLGVMSVLRSRIQAGEMVYLGTSAGANVACPTIATTNDMPMVFPESFTALDLVPFQINPHFVDADPHSTHMGETRLRRIAEYHEENDRSVVGLREGAWLEIRGQTMVLEGPTGAVLFRKNRPAQVLAPGEELSHLLSGE